VLGLGEDEEDECPVADDNESHIADIGLSARGESGIRNISCRSCMSTSSDKTDIVQRYDRSSDLFISINTEISDS
jgi:hypothetical protein